MPAGLEIPSGPAALVAQRYAREFHNTLAEINQGIGRLVEIHQSPRRNLMAAGTTAGQGTVGQTPGTCTVTVLGQNVGVILAANPRRRGLWVQNTGATGVLTVAPGVSSPQAGSGIVLPAAAGNASFWNGLISNELWTGVVAVIGSTAGVAFSYGEVMGPKSNGPNEAV